MDRNTPYRNGELVPQPVAAATMIYGGHMVALNAAGQAVPAATTPGLTVVGVSDEYADNTAGNAGDRLVIVRRHKVWSFANNSGDAVTQAMVGKACYVTDSTTVAGTVGADNTKPRPAAGVVVAVDADGVWVEI